MGLVVELITISSKHFSCNPRVKSTNYHIRLADKDAISWTNSSFIIYSHCYIYIYIPDKRYISCHSYASLYLDICILTFHRLSTYHILARLLSPKNRTPTGARTQKLYTCDMTVLYGEWVAPNRLFGTQTAWINLYIYRQKKPLTGVSSLWSVSWFGAEDIGLSRMRIKENLSMSV